MDKAVKEDANLFTDYYLRGPNSGTWWFPGAQTDRWRIGYERLLIAWSEQGYPDSVELGGTPYRVVLDHEKSRDFPDKPAFHHHHGVLMLPWGKNLHNDRHPIITVIGGKGSSKTWAKSISCLVHAATLPGYRAFVLAPYSYQTNEVYKQMQIIMESTLYYERFHVRSVTRPFPMIEIANDRVGTSTIEFIPVKENPEKLLTLTGDEAMIDQSEQIEDLWELIRIAGTRFRGRLPASGRSRLGVLTFIANSSDNQQLWDVHDRAEPENENYAAYTVSSYDNPYLTDKDIHNFELSVGGDEESIRVHLMGGRPRGNGKEFSREVLERMEDPGLDRIMDEHPGAPGYINLRQQGAGTYEWLLPPQPGRTYMVMSDPGTANPPERNSPPIMIWDIADFPDKPTTLAGFVWVFGNNNILNWATRFAEMVWLYEAKGRASFDATGYQAGYDTWMSILEDLYVEKISFTGNMKALCLNAAKIITARGLVKVPKALDNLFAQLSRYDFSEDKPGSKLRQDLVMCFIMSMWWLQRLYYTDDSPFQERPGFDPNDRGYRGGGDRYAGSRSAR